MDFAELFSNPSMMHAAVVHLPIAAAVFGLVLLFVCAIFHRHNAVRAVTALIFAMLAVTAYIAIETGEDARDRVPPELPAAVWDQVSDHVDSAENVLYAGIFTLACVLLSLIRIDIVRNIGLLLAFIGAIVANIFVAQTGHLGGTLVYHDGVGTPHMHRLSLTAVPVEETPESVPEVAEIEPEPLPAETPQETPAETPEQPAEPEMTEEPAEQPEAMNDLVPIHPFTPEEAEQVSYTRDIWPIIDDQCIVCHEDPDADGDFVMTTVAEMLQGGKKGGPGVVPGKPDESSVVKYIRGIVNPRMPEDEPPLPEEMLHKIRMWIAAGAIDDSEAPAPSAEPATEPAPDAAPEPAPSETRPAFTVQEDAAEMKENATAETTAPDATETAPEPADGDSGGTPATEETPATETSATEAPATESESAAESTDASETAPATSGETESTSDAASPGADATDDPAEATESATETASATPE